MEIIVLLLLYCLSSSPDFSNSVQPLFERLKNSESFLSFLKDLSAFSDFFKKDKPNCDNPCDGEKDEKNPRSQTDGIADEFIRRFLDGFLKKN